jgi:hypothetical protein
MQQMMECLLAQIKALQEKMDLYQEKITAKMDANQVVMEVCLEKMKSNPEKMMAGL